MDNLSEQNTEALHAFATHYQNELQAQLSQSDNTDSPINAAFHEWVRGQLGVKTPDDIKKENLLEYQKIIFLCEHDLIFNYLFHGNYTALRELFEELEHTDKNQPQTKENGSTQPLPILKTIPLATTEIPAAQIHEFFKNLETLRREQPSFDSWLLSYESLQQLEQTHAATICEITHEAYQEIDDVIISHINDEQVDKTIREALEKFRESRSKQRDFMKNESKKATTVPGAAPKIKETMLKKQREFERSVLSLFKKQKLEVKKVHQTTTKRKEKETKVNTHFEGLKHVLKLQLAEKNKLNRVEQKQRLEGLKVSISFAQSALQNNLNNEQKAIFNGFLTQLDRYSQRIDTIDTPEGFHTLFSECAEQLDIFTRSVQSIEGMASGLAHFKDVRSTFKGLAGRADATREVLSEMPINNSWANAVFAIPEVPITETQAQHSSDDVQPPAPEEKTELSMQERMKAQLQAERPVEAKIEHEANLVPLSQENCDEANELIVKISRVLNKTKNKADTPFAKDEEAILQIETNIQTLQVTLEESQSLDTSKVQTLKQAIETLSAKHPENTALSRIIYSTNELLALTNNPSSSAQLH